jgi:hypothetical protein
MFGGRKLDGMATSKCLSVDRPTFSTWQRDWGKPRLASLDATASHCDQRSRGSSLSPDPNASACTDAYAIPRIVAWGVPKLSSVPRRCPPKKPRLRVDLGGGSWTTRAPIDMRLQPARWMSLDVYGPWMAPRAGFEADRKFLSGVASEAQVTCDTPSDTPRIASLEF